MGDVDHVANALQNYLICFEMMLFAFAHSYTFSYKEFLPKSDNTSQNNPSRDVDLDAYVPPYSSIRTLNTPAALSTAFWSSTVPTETVIDITKLSQGGTSP